MARPCSVCSHKRRADVDAALASGTSNRRIATQFRLSEASVRRHGRHAADVLAEAKQARRVEIVATVGDSFAERLQSLAGKLAEAEALARRQKDLRGLVSVLKEAREQITTEAKLEALAGARGKGGPCPHGPECPICRNSAIFLDLSDGIPEIRDEPDDAPPAEPATTQEAPAVVALAPSRPRPTPARPEPADELPDAGTVELFDPEREQRERERFVSRFLG